MDSRLELQYCNLVCSGGRCGAAVRNEREGRVRQVAVRGFHNIGDPGQGMERDPRVLCGDLGERGRVPIGSGSAPGPRSPGL